jgi:hypothetical protein
VQTKKFVTIVVAVIVLAGLVGGALLGGISIGKNQSSSTAQLPGGTGQFPGGGNASTFNPGGLGMGGGTTGTVSSISDDVITLTTTNGSVQVYTNSSTRIEELITATLNLSDITTGENISVIGRRSQSGSVNATSIIIGSFQMTGLQP